MKKDILRFLGLSIVAVFVLAIGLSCGSSSSSGGGGKPTVGEWISTTSGVAIVAVDLNSSLYISLVPSRGAIDPTSIQVSLSPASPTITQKVGYSTGTFAGYVDVIPNDFLAPNTIYTVTTDFNVIAGNTTYPFTYTTEFTTTAAGTYDPSSAVGKSFIITLNAMQPPGLAPTLNGFLPSLSLAVRVISATASISDPNKGSMVVYGGQAVSNTPPTDIITTPPTLAFVADTDGKYFTASGSGLSLSIPSYGIVVPFSTFELSGALGTSGNIENGEVYAVVHCTDSACTNLGGGIVSNGVSPYLDTNNDMIVIGTFISQKNPITTLLTWIGSTDTTGMTLTGGVGSYISTATLKVTTTTSPLLTTATLPFLILAQTDSNNILSISAVGVCTQTTPTTSPVTKDYQLMTTSGTVFSTTAGTALTGYYLFGLSPYPTAGLEFTP